MDQEIRRLLKRLAFLGYCSFQIKSIIKDVIGNDDIDTIATGQRYDIIRQLETYEQLGLNYLYAYSK